MAKPFPGTKRPRSRWGDFGAVLLLVAVLALVVAVHLKFPHWAFTGNFGFGPDWACSFAGQGDPVCVKHPQ